MPQPNASFTSFLNAPIYYSDQISVTGSIVPVSGLANALVNITSWATPQVPARSVPDVPNLVIVVVDRLLYPADISLLFDGVVQDNSFTFGTNPPYPTVVNSEWGIWRAALCVTVGVRDSAHMVGAMPSLASLLAVRRASSRS